MIAIVAMDIRGGIGKFGVLPWNIPSEMKFFTQITKKTLHPNLRNAVIMGRTTYESIGKPLRDRHNIVLSNTIHGDFPQDNLYFMKTPRVIPDTENTFVIGGKQVYDIFIQQCDILYVTSIKYDYQCDTFFTIPPNFTLDQSFTTHHTAIDYSTGKTVHYSHLRYVRQKHELLHMFQIHQPPPGFAPLSL